MTYFLDTNICIYYLRGIYPAIASKLLTVKPMDVKIPSIVKAELLYGAEKSVKRDENIRKIQAFLMPMEIVPFGNSAAIEYGRIRAALEKASMVIGPNDLIIAATVLAENGILVTNNVKEFSRIPELHFENWVS